MGKPWEKYAESPASEAKPWEKYQETTAPVAEDTPAIERPSMLASIGRGMMDIPQGMTQGMLQGSEGIKGANEANAALGAKLGIKPQGAQSYTNNLRTEINNYERGQGEGFDVGRVIGNVATALPTALIPGANTYSGSAVIGGAMGASQPIINGESRGANAGKGVAAGIVAKFVSDKAAAALKNRFSQQKIAAENANMQNATKNASLKEGQDLGYVVPPTQANPSTTNQVLEGISGKIKTGQVASVKNQSVSNDLVRKSLNLPPEAPLTKETLQSVRAEAGKAYEIISQVPIIKKDAAYEQAIMNLKGAYSAVEKEAPELSSKYIKEFDNLAKGLNKEEFSGAGANEIIKLLRNEGNNVSPTANAAEKAIGKAQIKAANALEDLIDRTMTKQGNTEAVAAFREARKTIAKSYDVEKALTERGNVDIRKLVPMLKKGKLTGELKQAAKFAATFPKAAQEIDGSIPATSPLDWYGAITASAATGNPLPMALAGARPAIRSGILSKAYQGTMTQAPEVAPGMITSLGNSAANNQMLRSLAPAVGTIGSLTYGKE